jgi:hypothetical protein
LDWLLNPLAPRTATLEALRMGGNTLSCIPGEVTGAARRILSPATQSSPDAILISLCGGDVSYIEAASLWIRGDGERELSLFGPNLAQRLAEGLGACFPRAN